MKFVIHPLGQASFIWVLWSKDSQICQSFGDFDSVAAVRSDIARAKKSMSGAKFAKVEEPA